jgi:hypothetical protein
MDRSTYTWPRHSLEIGGQLHTLAALPPGKQPPSTHWIGRWVGPRTGLDNLKKRKFCPYQDLNSNSSAIQPVTTHYTNCTIPTRWWYVVGTDIPTFESKIKLTTNFQQSTYLQQNLLASFNVPIMRGCPVLQMLLPQPELGHTDRHGQGEDGEP